MLDDLAMLWTIRVSEKFQKLGDQAIDGPKIDKVGGMVVAQATR